MSREDDFATRMIADTTLMAILTGGVYKYSTTGELGITRDTATSAFDANGFLKPCALVKQRDSIPTGLVKDFNEQIISSRQILEIWLHQKRGSYAAIDSAKARLLTLFMGHQFSDSFELELAHTLERRIAAGALSGASMERQDWQVDSIVQ